jgi:hypothetical protein
MKKRVLGLLGLMGLVVAGSFAWHRQHALLPVVANQDSVASAALPVSADTLALEQESIEAIKADNADLEARIEALRLQQTDADKLIALKAARLESLENPSKKP